MSVPARPFCPDCAAHSGETFDMDAVGSLVTWTTLEQEGEQVTFGLVQIDGADTLMLHRIDAPDADLAEGLRLAPRWSAEPIADITAIEAFEPVS